VADFRVVDVPGMLSVPVKTIDKDGHEVSDGGEWNRAAAESQYVLAELLVAKGLHRQNIRRPYARSRHQLVRAFG
jgi:hypothetical protein